MHNFDHRRCAACGDLSISGMFRLVGRGFLIRCPNRRGVLRADARHRPRCALVAAHI